jgi:hypothetical protein
VKKFIILNLKFIIKGKSGQVALIVLIVSAVVLTFGLSISKKTTVETRIDTDEELLKKAFSAAESGIDYYLGSEGTKTSYSNPGNQERADVTVRQLGGVGVHELNFENYTLKNQKALFWLVEHNTDGSISSNHFIGTDVDICVDSAFVGALKVDYFYKDGATDEYKVGRYGFNIGGGSDSVSGFVDQALTLGCFNFPLGMGNKTLLVSVTPLFNNTRVSMSNAAYDFPSQGEEITSVGRAGDLSNVGVNKKVTVVRGYKVPFFMMDAITSGSRVLSK